MCDCEMPSAFQEAKRRARKEHWCDECRELIHVGDTYRHVSGIWDGTPSSYKFHVACDDLRHYAQNELELCDCVPLGQLVETMNEDIVPVVEALQDTFDPRAAALLGLYMKFRIMNYDKHPGRRYGRDD